MSDEERWKQRFQNFDENVLSEGIAFIDNDYFPLVSKLYNDLKAKL